MLPSVWSALKPALAIILVIATPLSLSLFLTYKQALESEFNRAESYAAQVQLKADVTGFQISQAFEMLIKQSDEDPCSESMVELMRSIDLASSYLQNIGYVFGDEIICSAYGSEKVIPIGNIDIRHSNGASIRTNVEIPGSKGEVFFVLERGGFAAIVNSRHVTDVATEEGVALALISRETNIVMESTDGLNPSWLEPFESDKPTTTVINDYIVAKVSSNNYLTYSIAAIPITNLHAVLFDYAKVIMPIGTATTILLVIIVLRLLHQRSELRQSGFLLSERVKELNMMQKTASILMKNQANIHDILQEIVELFPAAMQHTDVCAARIVFNGSEAKTSTWLETSNMLSSGFVSENGHRGFIQVGYIRDIEGVNMQAFLPEEHALVSSVAEMLASFLNKRHSEEIAKKLAYFEHVTQLPNRLSLEQHIQESIGYCHVNKTMTALVVININHFRDVVSTFGHINTDALLKAIAKRLKESLNDNYFLASMGGDEFALVISDVTSHSEIVHVINQVRKVLNEPAHVAEIPIKLEAAIGLAIYPEHGDTFELLMQRCEVALMSARVSHHDYVPYSADIDHYHPKRIALVAELPDAIVANQLRLHYQPKVELRTGRVIGVEALVRWEHPTHGLLFPDEFIPLAERTQLINSITHWVISEGLRQLALWREEGLDLNLAVNLSTRDLLNAEFCESIPEMATSSGATLNQITLELTETAIMEDPEQCKRLLINLHTAGIIFAMDDFGIGQSSLTYLKDLPIGRLKIDKSFVMDFHAPRNSSIVRAAIDMAHNLDMEVTAEGVENEDTVQALIAMGCDLGQGYLFSKPLPPDQFLNWLRTSKWGVH